MRGIVYLVATPIGNLADISKRALETLAAVDLVACEDTRHTGKLLNHFNIKKKLTSYHEHNEQARTEELTEFLKQGKSIAVVSDAGTPAISDPALRIVQRAHEIGAKVVAIPGAVAFVSALIVSGLPTDSFFFGGFLPSKKNERRRRLAEVSNVPATLLFYETPHRLSKSLIDCLEVLGNRKAAVARELTKLHEETILGTLEELTEKFSSGDIRGEIVLVIDRIEIANQKSQIANEKSLPERVAELENEGIDRKLALKRAAKEFGLPRSEAYRILQAGK
ncbi:MAG: 16S rRNA (cytidine(1402)-2'-O)-methyltransferase [uncultured Pyrinomonadaceae bacterium]|uniref:Ribosomal RNA small subunit methyltransferase I n=1 Tax=uncultured Pyrinomonadaceae bacterium TaxID=2283094 RepID=A0A6J4PMF0_9BACT|nr:MAG: 16S rRNA (cytidine(1402)-2'-O)-methyltransferase [uncultured Pyrinomonadaceae bacterium]